MPLLRWRENSNLVTRGDNIGQILISGHRNSQFLITLNQTVLACTSLTLFIWIILGPIFSYFRCLTWNFHNCHHINIWVYPRCLHFKTYSTLPNKRTYLNYHTYRKLSRKLISVPTWIAVPIGNHLQKNYWNFPLF